MTRMIDVRTEAANHLPSDVSNNNCVQDAHRRLREILRNVDATALYSESDLAPEYLVQAQRNLRSWIDEARRKYR